MLVQHLAEGVGIAVLGTSWSDREGRGKGCAEQEQGDERLGMHDSPGELIRSDEESRRTWFGEQRSESSVELER